MDEADLPHAKWSELVGLGGYPTPAHELGNLEAARLWFDGYIRTYLERDLRQLASIDGLFDFRRLMRIAALRLGNVACNRRWRGTPICPTAPPVGT